MCVCRMCVGVVGVGVVWAYLNEAGEKILDKMTLRPQHHESPSVSTGTWLVDFGDLAFLPLWHAV